MTMFYNLTMQANGYSFAAFLSMYVRVIPATRVFYLSFSRK